MDAHNKELALIREKHRFLTEEERKGNNWVDRMTQSFDDQLYREYALVDLSHHLKRRLGVRWRVEEEVVVGKGVSICGEVSCESASNLQSFEVPFSFSEGGKKKLELVKVRVCQECSEKLMMCMPEKNDEETKETDEEEERISKRKKKSKKRRKK